MKPEVKLFESIDGLFVTKLFDIKRDPILKKQLMQQIKKTTNSQKEADNILEIKTHSKKFQSEQPQYYHCFLFQITSAKKHDLKWNGLQVSKNSSTF